MDRIHLETFGLICPAFADKFVRCEAFERLEPSPEIVGVDEVGKISFQLCVIVVVKMLDGCFLDRSVHALDLAIGPWVFHLCQAMLDIVVITTPVEDVMEGIFMPFLIGELDAVICQNRMDGAPPPAGAKCNKKRGPKAAFFSSVSA